MPKPCTIALAGDVMLGRGVDAAIAARGFAYVWGDVLPLLWEANAFLVNLECALTARSQRWQDGEPKAFYFRADPSAVQALRVGRVDFASLANNHAVDFGMEGMLDTLRALDGAGIRHAGAGTDLAQAQAPAVLQVDDLRVAVVAFADYPPAWAAAADAPGINLIPVEAEQPGFARVERALAEARRQADLVIFSIHWGPNMRPRPSDRFREFARRVAAAGADVFWGHSAHLVQGVEVLGGRLILYDTGDFVDDYAVDPELRNDLSALFLLHVEQGHVAGLELVPVQIALEQVNLASGDARKWFARRFTALCKEVGTVVQAEPDRARLSIPVRAPRPAATA